MGCHLFTNGQTQTNRFLQVEKPRINTHRETHTHTDTHTHSKTHTERNTHPYSLTETHTHTHSQTHSHTHTHTHISTSWKQSPLYFYLRTIVISVLYLSPLFNTYKYHLLPHSASSCSSIIPHQLNHHYRIIILSFGSLRGPFEASSL